MSQSDKHKAFCALLSKWERRAARGYELTKTSVSVRKKDAIRLKALSSLYCLPAEEIAGELLHKALDVLETEMPYVQGNKVIRLEEGNEVYEDVGPMPRYLEAQKHVLKGS